MINTNNSDMEIQWNPIHQRNPIHEKPVGFRLIKPLVIWEKYPNLEVYPTGPLFH